MSPASATDLTTASQSALNLEQRVIKRTQLLTDEQRKTLSKVLFPDTHSEIITLLGKPRTLRPLPIKVSRTLSSQLQAFQVKIEEGMTDKATVQDISLIDNLLLVVDTLADFYGWEDVKKELVEGAVLTVSDLQLVVVQQVNLQETNDFLLIPLRVLVGMMQHAEIEMKNLQSIFSGLAL